jgi:hypothetical protein
MAEELAYFKGDMVLDSPESYTAEEMWDVVMEMLEATIMPLQPAPRATRGHNRAHKPHSD